MHISSGDPRLVEHDVYATFIVHATAADACLDEGQQHHSAPPRVSEHGVEDIAAVNKLHET